jgi:hypothetical protein
MLERDSKGRFFALGFGNEQVLVFDSSGRFQTAFGGKGDGPGEFGQTGARHVRVGAGDTVFVLDGSRRAHVFAPSLRFVRQFDVGATPIRVFALPDGGLVMSALVPRPANIGFPFHLVRMDGIVRSFGPEQRNMSQRNTSRGGAGGGRTVTVLDEQSRPTPFELGHDGKAILVLRDGRYMFHRWGLDGKDLGVIEVVGAPWLPRTPVPVPPVAGRSGMDYSRYLQSLPMQPEISLMGVEETGLYFVLGMVPRTPGVPRSDQASRRYLVEVLDPVSRQILLSQPVEEGMRFFPGGRYAFSMKADQDGLYSYTVWRLRLRRR